MKKIVSFVIFLFAFIFSFFDSFFNRSKILGKQLNNNVVLNTNQFNQTAVVGMIDLNTNPNASIFTMRYDSEATSTLRIINGEGVQLKDLGANDPLGVPFVDKRAADTDGIFGVKIFSTKENSDAPGEVFEVAGQGAVMWLEASAAIARGGIVALVIATEGQVVTRTTEEILGVALDKAKAANDLIRVFITARGFAELPLYELST